MSLSFIVPHPAEDKNKKKVGKNKPYYTHKKNKTGWVSLHFGEICWLVGLELILMNPTQPNLTQPKKYLDGCG